MSMRKIMEKIFVGTLEMILKRKILGEISMKYLGNISEKNLRGITGEISGQYFWKEFEGITGEIFVGYFEEDFGENIDHYIFLLISTRKQTF
jgi:hypothetical protein